MRARSATPADTSDLLRSPYLHYSPAPTLSFYLLALRSVGGRMMLRARLCVMSRGECCTDPVVVVVVAVVVVLGS